MSFVQSTNPSSDGDISIEHEEELLPQFPRQLSTFRSIESSVSCDVSPVKPFLVPLSARFMNDTGNTSDDINLHRHKSQALRSKPSLAPITRTVAIGAQQQQSNPPGCIQTEQDVTLAHVPMNDTITSQYEQQSTEYDSDMDSVYLPEPTSDEATVTSQKSPMTSNKQGSSLVLDLRSLYSQSYHR